MLVDGLAVDFLLEVRCIRALKRMIMKFGCSTNFREEIFYRSVINI